MRRLSSSSRTKKEQDVSCAGVSAPRLLSRHKVLKGDQTPTADTLSRLKTNGHEITEIGGDLSCELTIGAIMKDGDTIDLNDTFYDSKSYLDIVYGEKVVAKMTSAV